MYAKHHFENGWREHQASGSGVHRTRAAFSLIELVVILCLLALFLILAGPALGRTKPGTRSAQCLSNMRAMIAAWGMYARDYDERMVVAVHGGAALGGAGDPTWGVGWVSGWLDWSTGTDNTNALLLTEPRFAKLARYLPQSRAYKCPSDNFISPAQVARGWAQRCRSYSENIYIGAGNAETGPTDPLYKHVIRTSDLINPAPAQTWVFTEEHPDSINDPSFFAPHQTSWIDVPALLHNGATCFAFSDGHGEMHKWEGSLFRSRARQVLFSTSGIGIPASAGDPDIHWLAFHSARVSGNSY